MYTLERNFVKIARAQMALLETMWSVHASGPALLGINKKTHVALSRILAATLPVQARAIMRSVRTCEAIFTSRDVKYAGKLRASLSCLKRLIGQYSDGLIEIDPAFQSILENEGCAVEAQTKTDLQPILPRKFVEPKRDLHVRHSQAVRLLSPLMKRVGSEEQEQALNVLMRHGNKNDVRSIQEQSDIRFDTIMVPVTNSCLSEARLNGKNISVSYAADFELLSRDQARNISSLLEVLCVDIAADNAVPDGGQVSLSAAHNRNGDIQVQMHWATLGDNGVIYAIIEKHIETFKMRGKLSSGQFTSNENGKALGLSLIFASATGHKARLSPTSSLNAQKEIA